MIPSDFVRQLSIIPVQLSLFQVVCPDFCQKMSDMELYVIPECEFEEDAAADRAESEDT